MHQLYTSGANSTRHPEHCQTGGYREKPTYGRMASHRAATNRRPTMEGGGSTRSLAYPRSNGNNKTAQYQSHRAHPHSSALITRVHTHLNIQITVQNTSTVGASKNHKIIK